MTNRVNNEARKIGPLPSLIFASRWLQLPLYLGLIAAQLVYVVNFWVELVHLLKAAFGDQTALQQLITSVGYKTEFQSTFQFRYEPEGRLE